jgi:hypothetical protein
LEFPGEGVVLEVVLLPEDGEIWGLLQADFVIGSLKITMNDVLLAPRLLIRKSIGLLDHEEKILQSALEAPEAGATEDIKANGSTLEKGEKAEGVEGCMVAAEVVSQLLIDPCLVHV